MENFKDRMGHTVRGATVVDRVGWQSLGDGRRLMLWTFECARKHRFDAYYHEVRKGTARCPACKPIDKEAALAERAEQLIGARFGALKVLAYTGARNRSPIYLMQCTDCGRTGEREKVGLINTSICFCRKSSTTHGESRTSTHRAWLAMKNRCNNPKDINYANYGGRGIRVCDRWSSYENFRADMGPKPNGYHLDRIDNDGNYEPANCRWVTHSQNARNMRKSIKITWNGETKQLTDWSDYFGWPHNILSLRYHRGWTVEKMMTTPPRQWPSRTKK